MGRERYKPAGATEAKSPLPFPARGRRVSERRYERIAIGGYPGGEQEDPGAADETSHAAAEASRQQGYDAGYAMGREKAEAEAQGRLSRYQTALDDLTRLRQSLTEIYRQEMVEVAFGIAAALLQRELEQGQEFSRALVEQALEELGVDEPIHLALSPADAQQLESWLDQIDRGAATLTVQVDPDLAQGDIRARTPSGTMQSLMADRLARARRLVLGRSSGAAESPVDEETAV
ncbi:MAG: FliH/SctL family protein [Nannocystaceae bacterium]